MRDTTFVHTLSASDVYQVLETRPTGLAQPEATERLQRFGINTIQETAKKPILPRLIANFTHLMALLLWAGGIMALTAQLPQLAFAIWAVNLINGAFSFWQEYRAEKATEALRQLLPSYARVLRGGEEQRILAQELVPGDVLFLAEGDRISADARIVEEAQLRVDQSTLSGESNPVRKLSQPVLQARLVRSEISNLVFVSTTVVAGTAKAVVFATGMNTEFGKIAQFTQGLAEEPSPLQKELELVTRVVTLVALGVGAVFFVAAMAFAGITLAQSFIFTIGMIVAFVPEGLLPTVTLALAMGVQRMARRNALVKRLSAVETLGCTTIVCTDKTGTLTQNEMTVSDLWVGGCKMSVTGIGYSPQGEILANGHSVKHPVTGSLRDLLLAMTLCNNARLIAPNAEADHWSILGDPTEAALRVAALKAGVDAAVELNHAPRLREIPFDSRRKRMSTIHQREGQRIAYVKGAPQEVLALCKHIRDESGDCPLDPLMLITIKNGNDIYARAGLRVLAMGCRILPEDETEFTAETVERELTFLGLAAMMDPPRPEVIDAVQKCHRAGVHITMITGDYGLTAESIARRIGIIRGERAKIVTGADLDTMNDAELAQALRQEDVILARVAPEHKLRVVRAYQAAGQIVAVTGDGVNDAPALKKADIGIAMGICGTDVAKEAADMILLDDNFASIVNAIEEGRAVYANIKKFTTYIFTSNTPEAVPFILFALSRATIPLALDVMQILAIDLGTDMVPALALGAEMPEPGLMDRKPRSLQEHVITPSLLARAYLWLGTVQSLAAMTAFYLMYWTNGYWGQFTNLPSSGPLYRSAVAITLAAVVTTQIGNVFTQRTERVSLFKINLLSNRFVLVGIATELVLIGMIVYVPFFQQFFGTASFPLGYWLFLFAWIPALPLIDEVRKALVRRRERREVIGS